MTSAGKLMLSDVFRLDRHDSLPEDFRRETSRLIVERLRVATMLALILVLAFLPVDALRMPDVFGEVLAVRLAGCVGMALLIAGSYTSLAVRYAVSMAALVVAVITLTVLGIARFAEGPTDPIYLVQVMSVMLVILGTSVFVPADERTVLGLALVPFGLHVLLTLDFPFVDNLPALSSSLVAVVLATVGARLKFRTRLGDYEGRRSEARYRSLFEESGDAILVIGDDLRIAEANPAAAELIGVSSRAKLVGRDGGELYANPERDRERIRERLQMGELVKEHEIDLLTQGGERRRVQVTGTPVHDGSGRIVGAQVLLRDVTEQRELEMKLRQKQKLEAVGMLAAGVAHEINNPLTYILTDLDLLGQDLEGLETAAPDAKRLAEMRGNLAEALGGVEEVRRIVADLKSFSRLDQEERVSLDVNRILERTLARVSAQIRYRARLVTSYGNVPPVVGTEGRLSQVFLNLLLNALQALDTSRDDNEISARTWSEADEVVVEIRDTGAGIEPVNRERLFDPFFTTKPVGEGSGLGLSVCYTIVSAHGGRIEVESALSRGASFVVRLPAAERSSDAVSLNGAKSAPTVPIREHEDPRLRILVVDDEPFVLKATAVILQREHEVLTARSGEEALRILEQEGGVDVILCDLMMRDVSGMELYERLRDESPETARRIVFMTGGAVTQNAMDFLDNVPNRCIDKPFEPQQLLAAVEEAAA